MTLRVEKKSDGQTTTLRLSGHMQVEHLEAVTEQMQSTGPRIVLDLDEVTLVDVQGVRFLGRCEQGGTELLHCPPYIREWIAREQRP
jgi:anti-anti-sigma regulatory factor